jgi:hypothetical protein
LQPAQLEALQEEHPEDIDRVLPSLERETPLKHEKSRSTSEDWHLGQWMPFSEDDPNTSFSNSCSHFAHLYSNIGMTTSNHSSFDKAIIPQSSIFDRYCGEGDFIS